MIEVCIPCLTWVHPPTAGRAGALISKGDEQIQATSPQEIINMIRVATVDKWPTLIDAYGEPLPLRAIAHVEGWPMCWRHALEYWEVWNK